MWLWVWTMIGGVAWAEPQAWTCCETPGVEKVVEAYLALEEHLVDNDKGASAYIYRLEGLLRSLDVSALHVEDRAVVAKLTRDAGALKDKNLTVVRAGLDGVSRAVLHLALNYPGAGVTLVEARCQTGETWLQRPGALRSPYGDACVPVSE